MLKPELARQQLGKYVSAKHAEARMARVLKLPKPTLSIALGLLGRTADNKDNNDWEARRQAVAKAAKELTTKPKDRAAIMQAFFPTFAQDLEAGWLALGDVPYTEGWDRRAFRAPHRPELYAERRANWLLSMWNMLSEYDDAVLSTEWLAAWAIHLYGSDTLSYLFAGVINRGGPTGEKVFEILKDCAASRHEIGGMGSHVARALLCCRKPEAWEYTEKLLLAAQRQEGLRQAILECVDEAQPQAFQRMVGLLLDENLIRFSSVARATAVWLGEEESSLNPKKLKANLQLIRDLLGSESKRLQAVAKGEAPVCYRALWALAYGDVDAAVKAATPLLKDKKPERRFAAALALKNMQLPESGPLLLPLLDDLDWRVVALVVDLLDNHFDGQTPPADTFERLEKLIARLPNKMPKLKPIGLGWEQEDVDRERAAGLLLGFLDERPVERLLPHLPLMDVYDRSNAIDKLTEGRTLSGQVRELVFGLVGEPNTTLRESALKALKKCTLDEREAQQLESYLTRKTADFRRAVIDLLVNRKDNDVVATVTRLLATKDANQRLAGVEIARVMVDKERQAKKFREELTAYRERNKRLTKAEADSIEWVLNPETRPATIADCFGLLQPGTLASVVPPVKQKVQFTTPATVAIIKSLDELIHENRTKTFPHKNYDNSIEEVVLGSCSYYQFSTPGFDKPLVEQLSHWPLAELWQDWWANRSRDTRDADGLELLRANAHPMVQVREGEEDDDYWTDRFERFMDDADDDDAPKKTKAELAAEKELKPTPVKIRYGGVIQGVLEWLIRLHPPEGGASFVLDCAEHALALVPQEVRSRVPKEDDYWFNDWRQSSLYAYWLDQARTFRNQHEELWDAKHHARLYGLLRWLDEASPELGRCAPDQHDFFGAYKAKVAGIPDFIDLMVGPRTKRQYWSNNFSLVGEYSRDLSTLEAEHPELAVVAQQVLNRLLDVELARGEMPSEASEAVLCIQALYGAPMLFRLLRAFGKATFAKSSYYNAGQSKPAVLSHLIRVCLPAKSDTPEDFTRLAKEAIAAGELTEERLLELSCVNPKWVRFIEKALGWPGLCEAVWWLTAHTNNSWSDEEGDDDDAEEATSDANGEAQPQAKKKSEWGEIVAARTNLTAEQRSEGVVDVQWFHNAYNAVANAKRWDAIETAAKYLGYGLSSKKAGRLADVLLGVTKKKDLVDGIRTKNLKEYVRLLGLLPLPAETTKRESELLDRHKVLKDYERYARGLSSLSKEPALTAARIGLENLAVTAGYPDPLRLEWAVGAKTVATMLQAPTTVKVKNVEVTMTLGDFGTPEITQTKDGKPLKSIPTDVRKNTKVVDLLERRTELKRLAAGNKRSLELAMCQGDMFTAAEVVQLMGHPLVKPLLERLVLQADDVRGYPTADGKGLRDYKGKVRKIPVKANLIIAHPLDLLAAGDWHDWQAECFRVERLQPFKQVFRELYTITAQEKDDGTKSSRYAGQQVNENQANALFGSRGWSTREGIEKIFRVANLVATVNFNHGYTTPGEVEGLTIGDIEFHQRGEWKNIPLTQVPPKIFSEVMRDLDLVVSVAHVGGVDPEASASTVEMRTMLLKEMQTLLKLTNVKFDSKHALIAGEYGQYSVHLGSGVVHKQPGGSLCIVPVHSQHRGRLFLPFADDDPRTAEVVSKVLLLARDKDIQDPTILEQIAKR